MVKTVRYILLLGVVLAAVGAAAGYVASQKFGPGGFQSSAVAAAINWVAGSAGLVIFALAANKPWRVHAALLAMTVRMVIPLAALVIFTHSKSPLATHGVAGLVVVHYLVGLVVETAMSLRLSAAGVGAAPRAGGPAPTPSSAS